MLNDFKTFLSQNDKEALKEMSARIDTHTETVLSARATNAARTQRMDIARERRLDDEIGTTRALSHTEDIDFARTITELVDLQNAYEASLSATARTIQPSLLSVLG